MWRIIQLWVISLCVVASIYNALRVRMDYKKELFSIFQLTLISAIVIHFTQDMGEVLFGIMITIYFYKRLKSYWVLFITVSLLVVEAIIAKMIIFRFLRIAFRHGYMTGIARIWISLFLCSLIFFVFQILSFVFSFLKPKSIDYEENLSRDFQVVVAMVSTILFFGIYLMAYIIFKHRESQDYVFLLTTVVIIIIGFMAVWYYWQRYIKKLSQMKNYINQYETYIEALESAGTGYQKIRHDYKNLISTFTEFARTNDVQGIQVFIENEIGNMDNLISRRSDIALSLSKIAIKEVKGILYYKLMDAYEQNIEFEFEVNNRIDNVGISSVKLCRVLGIFLDNAIEATKDVASPYIELYIYQTYSGVQVVLRNTFQDEYIDINAIFNYKYTSKKDHKGLGLSIVNEIAMEEELILVTKIEDGFFIQNLTIPYR